MKCLKIILLLSTAYSTLMGQDSSGYFTRIQFRGSAGVEFVSSDIKSGFPTDNLINNDNPHFYFQVLNFTYFVKRNLGIRFAISQGFNSIRTIHSEDFQQYLNTKYGGQYFFIDGSSQIQSNNSARSTVEFGIDYRIKINRLYFMGGLKVTGQDIRAFEMKYLLKKENSNEYFNLNYTTSGATSVDWALQFCAAYPIKGILYAYTSIGLGVRRYNFQYIETIESQYTKDFESIYYPYRFQKFVGNLDLGLLLDLHKVYF